MFSVYWTDYGFTPYFNDYIYYNTPQSGGRMLDDTSVAFLMAIFIWFCFSLLKNRIELVRFIWVGILGIFSLSTVKYLWKKGLFRPFYRRLNKLTFRFRNLGYRGMGLFNDLGRNLQVKFSSLNLNDDTMFYLSEVCAVLFLLMVLFIFFLMTKCTNDSRSFVSFIFKDFLFICFLCTIFLIYALKFNFSKFRWPTFKVYNPWTDWNHMETYLSF